MSSNPSHPPSSSFPPSSSNPIISEGKEDGVDGMVEEDDEDEGALVSESVQQLAVENEALRRELESYRARYREDEKEQRRRVIGHRVSLTAQRDVHGVTIVNESLPPPQSYTGSSPLRSPAPVPSRQGRLTLSPPSLRSPVAQSTTSLSAPHLQQNAPLDQEEEGEVEMTQKQREGLVKTMSAPPSFSGDRTVDKTPDAREWVQEMEKWLRIHVGREVNKGLLDIVHGLLKGGAGTWMENQRKLLDLDLRARGMTGEVEWYEVREGFIEQFEGPQYRALIREELRLLRLWKGKCKSIPLFNSEFDRLIRRLYPSGQDLTAFIPILAEEYGSCIRHSDEDLYTRCTFLTIPQSVEEWRERAVSCYATRETLKAPEGDGKLLFLLQIPVHIHGSDERRRRPRGRTG